MLSYDDYILTMTEQTITGMSLTTIKLDSATRDALAELGKKNESYDTILKRLISYWKKSQPERD